MALNTQIRNDSKQYICSDTHLRCRDRLSLVISTLFRCKAGTGKDLSCIRTCEEVA